MADSPAHAAWVTSPQTLPSSRCVNRFVLYAGSLSLWKKSEPCTKHSAKCRNTTDRWSFFLSAALTSFSHVCAESAGLRSDVSLASRRLDTPALMTHQVFDSSLWSHSSLHLAPWLPSAEPQPCWCSPCSFCGVRALSVCYLHPWACLFLCVSACCHMLSNTFLVCVLMLCNTERTEVLLISPHVKSSCIKSHVQRLR